MHKSWDTFLTVRDALIKEIIKLFLDFVAEHDIDDSANNFEIWLDTQVKSPIIKLVMEIQKYFGTSIWLYRAGTRANYFKICRAAMKVFSGLFHINGNLHYSTIKVFDDF